MRWPLPAVRSKRTSVYFHAIVDFIGKDGGLIQDVNVVVAENVKVWTIKTFLEDTLDVLKIADCEIDTTR